MVTSDFTTLAGMFGVSGVVQNTVCVMMKTMHSQYISWMPQCSSSINGIIYDLQHAKNGETCLFHNYSEEAQYPNHHNIEKKSDEPRDEGVAAPVKFDDYATLVEATDRSLFDFVGKKEEKKKCEEEVIATQFEEKVKVSEPEYKKEEETKEGEKKHESQLQKLNLSNSSSSSINTKSRTKKVIEQEQICEQEKQAVYTVWQRICAAHLERSKFAASNVASDHCFQESEIAGSSNSFRPLKLQRVDATGEEASIKSRTAAIDSLKRL
ncbi:putative dehydrin [Forsythia ovata]|uniref:Dehydrin n=1 Tax=Forsythia ovata TaxID=205694 RepID=A0ABD1STC0_9LAMI